MSRPAPQYGEYATPEEVAALRGAPVDPPAGIPVAAGEPVPPAPASGLRRFDRPLTIALVLFGIINLVQYGGALLDFEGFLEVATVGTAAEPVDFGEAARLGGLVMLVVALALLVGSAVVAYRLSRRGRIAFWAPLAAGLLTGLAWIAVLAVILLQTPGALPSAGP